MKYPMDNQYRYGLCYDLNGQITGFNLSPDLFICLTDDDIEKALETYVKRKLQPEPFINKPCVSEQACHEDKMKILEKIKAEIDEYKSRQLPLGVGIADLEEGKQIALEYVLAILDKYMAESEDKE